MTKATLKHIANQYVLIVDERPKIGDKYISIYTGCTYTRQMENDKQYSSNHWKIIAAENLKGVKGIRFEFKLDIFSGPHVKDGYIKKKYTDTEVEVTEDEDYWVVRL